ncbi:MAG: response regulator [Deltaproteobacteria bacterium]|nr:response regulator [Deltaproteobacteria bacterium]
MNRILVVDDDDVAIRLLYTDELAEEGYDVRTRQGGPGLLELIETKRPDLVVVDITPRKNDGSDLFQDIRNLCDDLPVILSTLYSNGQPDRGLTVNDCLLEKCSNLRELKRTIGKTFGSNEHFPLQDMSDCPYGEMRPL